MQVKVRGKITRVFDKRSGVAKASGKPWVSQSYMFVADGDNENDALVFSVFGEEAISTFALRVDLGVEILFSVYSREYQGRYFTECRALDVKELAVSVEPGVGEPTREEAPADKSDLPF